MKSVLVRNLSVLFFVPLMAGFTACEDSTGPRALPTGVEIEPKASVFPIQIINGRKWVRITAVVRNDSDRAIYYAYCTERISIRANGVWAPFYSGVCLAILVPPERIGPGESKEVSITAIEQLDGSGFPFKDPGAEYRFGVGLLLRTDESSDGFVVIEPDETVSGTFTVR